jgi:hypothetical protein
MVMTSVFVTIQSIFPLETGLILSSVDWKSSYKEVVLFVKMEQPENESRSS